MYVKVIKPELIFDLPRRRTFLGKLLQRVVLTDEKGHVWKLTQNTDLVLRAATNQTESIRPAFLITLLD